MKKILVTLAIGTISFSFACDKCNLSNSNYVHNTSLQDYKMQFFDRIILEEKRLASLKECMNKTTVEEISNCEKSFTFHKTGCDCESCSAQQNKNNLAPISSPFLNKPVEIK